MASSVDGLVSGLSTTQLISQLMQVEAAPQTKLKSTLSNEQDMVKTYQSVNTKMSALKTAATALTSTLSWQAMKATSASDAITVSAGSNAVAGQVAFNVVHLAKAQVSTAALPAAGDLVGPGGLDITVGDPAKPATLVTKNIPLSDFTANTPQGVADVINAKGYGVRAAVITTDTGSMLQLTASKTGLANSFSVAGLQLDPGVDPHIAVNAADAQLGIGDAGAPGAYTVSSSTNTFTNVLPGLTVTANKQTTDPALVTVVSDSGKLADQMQAMVDATNGALDYINSQSQYDADTKTGGPLLSDSSTRFLSQRMLSAVSNGRAGYGSFSQLGLSLDQTGKLTFDRDKFLTAVQDNPDKVKDAVTKGVAATLQTEANSATDITNGSITLAIQGRNSKIKDLNNQIADWDTRLKTRQDALQRQFANLEVSLGKLKDQSNWLAGQISSLPSAAKSA